VVVVVVLVVFAEAPFRHACFPSLPPFPLFAVVVAINFEEEEEEEEASDDDLIGILDPVKKSAILYSHLLIIPLSLFSLLSRESAASLERTVLVVVIPLVEGVLLLKEEEEGRERGEERLKCDAKRERKKKGKK
jgi:hypothetical protein